MGERMHFTKLFTKLLKNEQKLFKLFNICSYIYSILPIRSLPTGFWHELNDNII